MSGGCMFCFKQKTVYELRISDWSSDVCSSDLAEAPERGFARAGGEVPSVASRPLTPAHATPDAAFAEALEELRDCRVCAAHLPRGPRPEIGRALCRERECQCVTLSVVAVSSTKQPYYTTHTSTPIYTTH